MVHYLLASTSDTGMQIDNRYGIVLMRVHVLYGRLNVSVSSFTNVLFCVILPLVLRLTAAQHSSATLTQRPTTSP